VGAESMKRKDTTSEEGYYENRVFEEVRQEGYPA
jgi:hypothetical protein